MNKAKVVVIFPEMLQHSLECIAKKTFADFKVMMPKVRSSGLMAGLIVVLVFIMQIL